MKILTFATLVLLAHPSGAQEDMDLSQMNESDKNKTGLYKLSDSEVKALQKWLDHKHKTIKKVEKENNAGFEQRQQADRDTIVTTLEKMYKDPLGNTYYKLTNGQVWKQVQSGRVTIKKDGSQSITIEPMMMGSWMLKGDGNRGVKVKRIR